MDLDDIIFSARREVELNKKVFTTILLT